MASAIGGVPGSKRAGGGANVEASTSTFSIISPPPMKGGMDSSRSGLPHRKPMPVGPAALCADATTQSAPREETSTGPAGTDWHASSSRRPPAARTSSPRVPVSARTDPRTLEAWTRATTLTLPACSASNARTALTSISVLSAVRGTPTTRAPVRAATSCQGTRLAWCSATLTRMTSPGFKLAPPHAAATKLIPSVAPRVNTSSEGDPAPMNAATFARAASYAVVARAARACTPRCTLELSRL
jgi:hypothetical protein